MKVNLKFCARCGQDHIDLKLKPFTNPVKAGELLLATHFATCPTNAEPILVTVTPQ